MSVEDFSLNLLSKSVHGHEVISGPPTVLESRLISYVQGAMICVFLL